MSVDTAYPYDYLISCKRQLLNTYSHLYQETKKISDAIPYSEIKVDNKVYRMCNSYVAECAVKDYLTQTGHKIEFIGRIEHEYFHPGPGSRDPDLIDELGTTFEVKSGKTTVENYN